MNKNLKVFAKTVEEEALNQIMELSTHPAFKDEKIRIMPDVHSGKGCVIGFTSTYKDKVIPNVVGVDIGCGVFLVRLGIVEIDCEKFDKIVKETIPMGSKVNNKIKDREVKNILNSLRADLDRRERLELSLGSLGGGNHFIELGVDKLGVVYMTIHTGSRNLGLQIAEYYQEKAVECCKDLELKKDLCYIKGQDLEDYLHDMNITQEFALKNRREIATTIIKKYFGEEHSLKGFLTFDTVHNYIEIDKKIIRKGAIRAEEGEYVLIPINMRDGSLIAIGKGNEDWNNSAPHGAGRIMSRGEARRTIKLKDFEESMKGIYSTTVGSKTIDESPFVYKEMDEIIEATTETIEIAGIIRPFYNVKG